VKIAFERVLVNVLLMGVLPATAAGAATGMPIPVHGTALAIPTRGVVVAVLDGIPAMYPSQTRRYRSTARFRPGETFDAYLDPRTATLEDVNAAAEFVPGLPNHLVTHVMARGDQLPDYRFVAQNGRSMRFSDFPRQGTLAELHLHALPRRIHLSGYQRQVCVLAAPP